jgi:hypothetical protein
LVTVSFRREASGLETSLFGAVYDVITGGFLGLVVKLKRLQILDLIPGGLPDILGGILKLGAVNLTSPEFHKQLCLHERLPPSSYKKTIGST